MVDVRVNPIMVTPAEWDPEPDVAQKGSKPAAFVVWGFFGFALATGENAYPIELPPKAFEPCILNKDSLRFDTDWAYGGSSFGWHELLSPGRG